MEIKYEKITEIGTGDNISKEIEIVDKKDATHIHKCGHDQDPPMACSREKI